MISLVYFRLTLPKDMYLTKLVTFRQRRLTEPGNTEKYNNVSVFQNKNKFKLID